MRAWMFVALVVFASCRAHAPAPKPPVDTTIPMQDPTDEEVRSLGADQP